MASASGFGISSGALHEDARETRLFTKSMIYVTFLRRPTPYVVATYALCLPWRWSSRSTGLQMKDWFGVRYVCTSTRGHILSSSLQHALHITQQLELSDTCAVPSHCQHNDSRPPTHQHKKYPKSTSTYTPTYLLLRIPIPRN
jgi:hypothetical protein